MLLSDTLQKCDEVNAPCENIAFKNVLSVDMTGFVSGALLYAPFKLIAPQNRRKKHE